MEKMTLQDLAARMEDMKFRRRLFGVDEADVLDKMQDLSQSYELLLRLQEEKYRALLEERDTAIRQLRSS